VLEQAPVPIFAHFSNLLHSQDYESSMSTRDLRDVPANTAPLGRSAVIATTLAVFVSILSIYLLLRPPLFNYDGYTYRLQALQPAEGGFINPHHLLWYPIQRVIAEVGSAVGSPSPEVFQLFGVLINSVSLALLCLLLVRLTNRLAVPVAMTIFIAFSPRIWNLGLQNQPYPLLDLFVVVFLWTVAGRAVPSRLRLAAGGLALAAAVLLQQAMALVVPAVAFGFVLAGEGPFKGRLKLAAIWAGGTTLVVAAVYALMARAAGVKATGFLNWTLAYLHTQHGIRVDWLQSPVKSASGLLGTVLDTAWIRNICDQQKNGKLFWGLYGGLAVAGCIVAVVLVFRRGTRERLMRLLLSNMLFTSVVMMVLAWSSFVFFWEPAGYYWSVDLFPIAVLASLWLRASRRRTALLVAGALVAVSGWNLHANHRQDQANNVSFPPPLLEQIHAQLGPNDVFIVAGREWYAGIDYDLLLECLGDWPSRPAKALLDEYVMPGSGEPWQQKLDRDIWATLASGGRVFVADHVFWSETYHDLEQTADIFSAYPREEFAGVNGEKLRKEIQSYFDRYQLTGSNFKIAKDPFWELKRIK
jgi:hypothetical protein